MNMSVAPQTTIRHQAGDRRSYGRGFVFRLPAYREPLDVDRLWQMVTHPDRFAVLSNRLTNQKITPQCCYLPVSDVESHIRERLDMAARKLTLPTAAIVSDTHRKGDKLCRNILHVLTVLSKSSEHVYLRDKEPNLTALRPGRKVVLVIPESFPQSERTLP
jgi:hypothetical protein